MTTAIVFTGGGTAGHVTPNLALIEALQKDNWQIDYIGSHNSVEQEIISKLSIPFHAVKSGKLRRYFSWKNFIDPFKILYGIVQAYYLLGKLKTNILFSKGGFVAFPVVVAAYLRRIPVIAHESDISPGLANRLSFPFVNKICLTFELAKKFFKDQTKVEVTGTPIRAALFSGSKEKGLDFCKFSLKKPCILIMGGSQGAEKLNKVIRQALPTLLQKFQIIHLCGKSKLDSKLALQGYCQFEYIDRELADLYAAADLIISRSGANSLYEILALGKLHILIPLSAKVSRGDQIQNAEFFKKQGISTVIDEESLTEARLAQALEELFKQQDTIKARIRELNIHSATSRIVALIKEQLEASQTMTISLKKTIKKL